MGTATKHTENIAKIFAEKHKKACETWENGDISKVWVDSNKNICIKYANGKWWHYNEKGEWW
jgi:hypothetical protein